MNRLLNGGRTIRGDSVPQVFIPKLIDLYRANKLPLDRLVREYALTDGQMTGRVAGRGLTSRLPQIRT